MEIKYVDYGIANRIDNAIEINEGLKNYPKLHDAILKHELSHTSAKGFTKSDFLVDFGESKVNNLELIRFMLKNPKSFIQILPVYKREGIIYYDINLSIFWFTLFSVITLGIILAKTL